MKIGVLGGSFNPIHNGHIKIARTARKTLSLDRVIFVPAKEPPHKKVRRLASASHRLKMAELALEGNSGFTVSDIELNRPDKSYTIDTIREFRRQFAKDAPIFFLIGADTISELPTWKDIDELTDLCQFVTISRKGSSKNDFDGLRDLFSEEKMGKLKRHFIEMDPVPISATEIREKVSRRESIDGLVPRPVADYIARKGLYKKVI